MATPLFYLDEVKLRQSTSSLLDAYTKYYKGKENDAYNLAVFTVSDMRNYWDSVQNVGDVSDPAKGQYWHNWTYKAVTHMFFKAYQVGGNIGFYGFYSANLEYAEPLEQRFGALSEVVGLFADQFLAGIKKLYEG